MAKLITSKICAFIDLSTIKLSYKMFVDALSSFASNLVYLKYYNYVPSKHFEFLNIPCKLIEYEKSLSNKPKTKIDIRQAIDIAENVHSENQIFCLLLSEIDSEYLLDKIKSNNKKIILLQSSQSSITKYADTSIIINRNAEFINTPYIQLTDTIRDSTNTIHIPLVYENFNNGLSIKNVAIQANPNNTYYQSTSSDIKKALVYENSSNDLSVKNVAIQTKPNDTYYQSTSSNITKALVYENSSNDLSVKNVDIQTKPNDTHYQSTSSDITKALETLISATKQNKLNYLKEKYGHLIK